MPSREIMQGLTRHLKTTERGTVKTELDQVIAPIPWGNAFKYGAGVDAVTGSITASAVNPFDVVRSTVRTSSEHYSFIQSDRDLNTEIETSASGKYNIEGVNVTASASYLAKIKFSELRITLVAQYRSHFEGYDEAPSYQLTDAARGLIKNPDKFRKAYGDYFISGGRRSALFTAVYTCQATSAERMDEFKMSFGGEAPEVFSAEGSARFLLSARSHNVSITTDIFMEGYVGTAPSGPWTPEKVMAALDWFKQNERGIHLTAKLSHYSTVEPTYPRTIDVSANAFVELRQLYATVWELRVGYNSLPAHYQGQYKSEYTALEAGVVAKQGVLAIDAAERRDYRQKTDALLSEVSNVFARMDFYQKVKAAVAREPGKGAEIEEGGDQQIWMYGYGTYTKSSAVVIHCREMHYSDSWRIGWREHTFEFGPDGAILIVGWQVVSNWGDGTNGSWWKAVDQILLTDHSAVHVKSDYDRGCDWTLRVYYVDAKDYLFDPSMTVKAVGSEEERVAREEFTL